MFLCVGTGLGSGLDLHCCIGRAGESSKANHGSKESYLHAFTESDNQECGVSIGVRIRVTGLTGRADALAA